MCIRDSISGKSASIGIEDPLGTLAVRYAYHASPSILTNGQALLFSFGGTPETGPSLILGEPGEGKVTILGYGQPGRQIVISSSSDAQNWIPVETNTMPASGII